MGASGSDLQYAILITIVFHVAIKYILHTTDLRNAHPWEQKAVYLLYTELIIGRLGELGFLTTSCAQISCDACSIARSSAS